MKTKHWIALLIAATVIGFFAGRKTTKTKEVIRYVQGETVQGEYPSHLLKPIKIEVPDSPDLPYYLFRERVIVKDSIAYIVKEVDSSKVYQDYIARKTYDLALFNNNKQGDFKGTATVQYNDLQSFDYSYTPISKEVTIISKPKYTPFASASFNTFGIAGAGAGMYYKNIGAGYKFLYDTTTGERGHETTIKIKF